MILNTVDDLRKHVSVAKSFEFVNFEPYIEKAVDKFTEKYIGNLHVTLSDEQTDIVLQTARYRLQKVIANFGMFLYMPLGTVIWDNTGLSQPNNEKRVVLDWQQKADIQRELLSSGHEALDKLLSFMEANKDKFPAWADSKAYTVTKELLVNNTETFSKWYHIFESRQTYLALQPSIRQVEDQYLDTFLCPEFIKHLKETDVTGVQLKVKEHLQKAIVAFTVAKVCEEGLFVLSAAGIKLKFDRLPWESVQSPDYGKPAEFITKTVSMQKANGENYLQLAKKLIEGNISEFNTFCSSPIITMGDDAGYKPYSTGSILAL